MVGRAMDKHIKAQFRETARTIVSRDRGATRGGFSNNLPGDITAAIVAAYKLGLEHANNPPKERKPMVFDEALIWETIPSTSRNVLSSISSSYSQFHRKPTFQPSQLSSYLDEHTGRERWAVCNGDGSPCVTGQSFATKGIGPLVRLGLLAPDPAQDECLCLTSKGDATCREYWLRSDRDDPSLPIQSMRG